MPSLCSSVAVKSSTYTFQTKDISLHAACFGDAQPIARLFGRKVSVNFNLLHSRSSFPIPTHDHQLHRPAK